MVEALDAEVLAVINEAHRAEIYFDDMVVGMDVFTAIQFCTALGYKAQVGYPVTRDYNSKRVCLIQANSFPLPFGPGDEVVNDAITMIRVG